MPQALQVPLLCCASATLPAADDVCYYEEAVREAIRLGGCSASRAIFVGACAAALSGSPPPDDWMARFGESKRTEVLELAEALADLGES
mmetsp:Transcript_11321/g.22385  ORF Transcript_11321/g.22385 Transcript_11321/m.22385 type:complete len:89 (-) Transcript_11321:243-509(-)